MTPKERASEYWQAQRNAEDCSLVEWFKRCDNEALERAALIAWDCGQTGVAGRIRELKHD